MFTKLFKFSKHVRNTDFLHNPNSNHQSNEKVIDFLGIKHSTWVLGGRWPVMNGQFPGLRCMAFLEVPYFCAVIFLAGINAKHKYEHSAIRY